MTELPFLGRRGRSTAIIEPSSGTTLTYDDLADRVDARAAEIGIRAGVALMLCTNTLSTVVDYLGALQSGLAVMPLDSAIDPVALAGILDSYRPEVVLGVGDRALAGYEKPDRGIAHRSDAAPLPSTCADLALLLSTSGSTGSPRMVRLTASHLAANTASIVESLAIGPGDRAITSMPLHYSYGLSVLNSHLAAGGSVVVSDASVIDPAFWAAINEHEVTTFAGVPYTFAMLTRLRYQPSSTPSIRKITQAGGKLDAESTARFLELFSAAGVGLYIMYGQTEAGPRISCLPADRLAEKLGSAGLPMSGGTLSIDEIGNDVPPGTRGEIVYSGPNVMLGYATTREELTCADDTQSVLRTGDLGYLDEDGFLFITGRIKRIAKLFGSRVSLDEVEGHLASLGPVAVVGVGEDKLHVHHQNDDEAAVAAARKTLSLELKVPLAAIVTHRDSEFPLMPSGKVDYRALTAAHEESAP